MYRLNGGDGNDRLFGGTGANSMVGGKGNDTYYLEFRLNGDQKAIAKPKGRSPTPKGDR